MYLRIDPDSSLYRLLTDFLAAYNRRTDVMEASTDVAIQRQVDALVADLKTSTDKVESAIKDDKGE